MSAWESYKGATGLDGQEASDQLWHCHAGSLIKKVHNSGVRPTDPEAVFLQGIKKLAVKAHNNLIDTAFPNAGSKQ